MSLFLFATLPIPVSVGCMDYRPNLFLAYLAGFRNTLGSFGKDIACDWSAIRSITYDTAGDIFTRYGIQKVTHVKQTVTETIFEYQCKCAYNSL
jgi:hypothetical protein